jgi:signal transduction histidine kinase
MAVQLHQRRCGNRDDESLRIAQAQLKLTEQQVQGLLALSRDRRATAPGLLGPILQEVRSLVRLQAEHMRATLELEVDACDGVALADQHSFRAAILNLLLNAIEAAGVGGRVRLSAETSPAGVRVHVADNGAGPPEQLRDRLFEPFVTGKPEGIGLGLALAQQAAEIHGGSLHWRRENGWTVFTIDLLHPPGMPAGAAESEAVSEPVGATI